MSDVQSVWREKKFDDGRTAWVIPLTFGRARIVIFRDWMFYDDAW